MPITLVTTLKDITRRHKVLTVSGTVSGNYTPGGIATDLSTITNPKLISGGKPASNPIKGVVVNVPAGYDAELIAGATIHTWLIKVYQGGNELGAVAFPAALLADPFVFEFTGKLGNF